MATTTANPGPFRVIIAGGGIGGLILANVLERAGVDYILVEKRHLAPEMGANLVIFPCMQQLLDRFDVLGPIRASTDPLTRRQYYDEKARLFATSFAYSALKDALGSTALLTGHQQLLQALVSGIRDPSRLRDHCGVVAYAEDHEGVTVTTDAGEKIRGDMLVGVDGVHSTVRGLLAEAIRGEDAAAAENLTSPFRIAYQGIFGCCPNDISPDAELLEPGASYHSFWRAQHLGMFRCKTTPREVTWNCTSPMPGGVRDDDPTNRPRYTKEDCESFIAKYGDLPIENGRTIKMVYEKSTMVKMVSLEEGMVTARWNSGGRLVLLGDSVHTMTNNAGLGANAACSAVCNLANELLPVVKEAESTGSGRPTTAELTAAFDRYEAKQRPIGKSCISMSRRVTAMATSESWLWSAVNRYVMPCIPARLQVLPIVTLEEKLPRLNHCLV